MSFCLFLLNGCNNYKEKSALITIISGIKLTKAVKFLRLDILKALFLIKKRLFPLEFMGVGNAFLT